MKKCVFAGTFDPVTIGHIDMIEQCAKLFDEVVVAILVNPDKTPFFTLAEREKMLSLAVSHLKNVRLCVYQGLVTDLLKEEETPFYVRGIRNGTDYDYETQTNYINQTLYPELVTLYLPTMQEHLHISSSLVRNAIKFRKSVAPYVPESVLQYIDTLIEERNKNV